MSVIDPARMAIVATIPTRTGARSGAIDPATGDIYLPSAELTAPVVPNARPTMTPGSFQILKISN